MPPRLSVPSSIRRTIPLAIGLGSLLAGWLWAAATEKSPPAEDRELARARREVRMLDDLYKTAIVLINDTYVEDETGPAAGEVARHLFAAMNKKGWHEARLLDATGRPVNDDNAPADAFEKAAIQQLAKGAAQHEAVETSEGKRVLRIATAVPAVNAKCLLCHPDNKVGDLLGAVSYRLPLEP